jgi:hypothetical protein
MNYTRRTIIISLIVVSGWVFVCPWVIADAGVAPASWSFYVAGALSIILGIAALVRSDDLSEYGLVAVAGWLVISPWILGLSEIVTRQDVVYGVVIGFLAWIGRPSFKTVSAPS